MPIVAVILGIIIIALGAAFFLIPAPTDNEPINSVKVEVNESPSVPTKDESVETVTLVGTGKYQTPARTNQEIVVTLTLENDIVTAADVDYDGKEEGYSNPNQERFDGAYKAEVIGKSLAEISLSRVGGASLTSRAFNDAVESMKIGSPS